MLGRTHATSGAVLAMAVAPLLTTLGVPATGGSIAVMAVAAAGGAMLPDLDHRHATTANALGPVTKALAIGIETVSGGHRNGTHTPVGVAVFTGFSWWMVHLGGWPLGLWLGFLLAVGMSGLQVRFSKKSAILHTLICLVGTVALVRYAVLDAFPFDLVTWGVAIGATAHLAGDVLTKEGLPSLLWPFLPGRFHLGAITTGQFTERVIIGPLLGVVAVVQVFYLAGVGPVLTATIRDVLVAVRSLTG